MSAELWDKSLLLLCDVDPQPSSHSYQFITTLVSQMVQGDYLSYLQIPVHHGWLVQQSSNYVSLSFSAAMPRLMMCAWATFQAPSLLLSALEMKQFPHHGRRYRITCIQHWGGRYYDETPAETGNLVSARIKLIRLSMQTLWGWRKQFICIGDDEQSLNGGRRCNLHWILME